MNPENPSLSRRDALKILGAGAVLASLGLVKADAAESVAPTLGWELPPLGFGYGALEPHIDAMTMEIHYTKHHQAYINNAKKLLESHPDLLSRGPEALVRDLNSVPEAIRSGIRNNAGGHVNHSFFWPLLAPGGATAPTGALADRITTTFGGLDKFKEEFGKAATTRFGSGWAWLLVKTDGSLEVISMANQDSPLSEGLRPILGLDVWEHAYYLHYQNRRPDYVKAFWNVVNWTQAEANYAAATKA